MVQATADWAGVPWFQQHSVAVTFFYTHCRILLCILQNWFYYLELACCFENCDKTYRKWSNKAFLGWKRGNWNEPFVCNFNQLHRLYISLGTTNGSAQHPVGGRLWRRRCVIVWHIAQAQASHWEPSCRFAFASMESLLGEEQRWSVAAICPTHIEGLFVCFVLFFGWFVLRELFVNPLQGVGSHDKGETTRWGEGRIIMIHNKRRSTTLS